MKPKLKKEEDFKKIILAEYKRDNIVICDHEGLKTMPLDEIIKQPTDGLLYDLNRNEAVIFTFIDDPKWINDYACAQVIRKLKDNREQYAKEKSVEFAEWCDNVDMSTLPAPMWEMDTKELYDQFIKKME